MLRVVAFLFLILCEHPTLNATAALFNTIKNRDANPRDESPQISITHNENRADLIAVAAKIIAARTDGRRFYFARVSESEREELRQSFNRLHNELNVSVLQIARMLGRTQSSVWQLFIALNVPRRGV